MTLKASIIEESLRLFSLKGFFSTSLHDILEASGASKGGFYNHFKSKEDLFFHVLQRAREIWRDKNLKGIDRMVSPVEKLERLLTNYRDRYLKNAREFPGGCVFITLSVELNDQSPRLFAEIDKGFVGLKNLIHRYIEAGKSAGEFLSETDTGMMTEILFNGMLGASVCYGANKSSKDLNRSIQALLNLIATFKNRSSTNRQNGV